MEVYKVQVKTLKIQMKIHTKQIEIKMEKKS